MKLDQLTTPKQMKSDVNQESDKMAEGFEREFKHQAKGRDKYTLTIGGEFSKEACQRIENSYKHIGWRNVSCKVIENNGYLTELTLTV